MSGMDFGISCALEPGSSKKSIACINTSTIKELEREERTRKYTNLYAVPKIHIM